jgi:hypothetical protein
MTAGISHRAQADRIVVGCQQEVMRALKSVFVELNPFIPLSDIILVATVALAIVVGCVVLPSSITVVVAQLPMWLSASCVQPVVVELALARCSFGGWSARACHRPVAGTCGVACLAFGCRASVAGVAAVCKS